jgi:hypothetical protein
LRLAAAFGWAMRPLPDASGASSAASRFTKYHRLALT